MDSTKTRFICKTQFNIITHIMPWEIQHSYGIITIPGDWLSNGFPLFSGKFLTKYVHLIFITLIPDFD